jgi:hypothetical protein
MQTEFFVKVEKSFHHKNYPLMGISSNLFFTFASNQGWEDRLYKTLNLLDPDTEWEKWTTKRRIKNL